MEKAVHSPRLVRFGTFEVDLPAGELRKSGARLKLTGQPFQVLAILLESPGEVVAREELQKRLWRDTFVDADHNLNTAINKIREVLGDSAESPRFWLSRISIVIAVLILLAAAGLFIYRRSLFHTSATQRALTRLTFDPGLQIGVTWSPDGRYIAYGSNRSGKFDNWLQQVSGGNPVQITKGPGNTFESPGPTVPRQIPDVELSLTQDKLVLTMEELSGSIWVLDNVGP